MKKIHSLITIIALVALVACGGGETKVKPSDDTTNIDTTGKSDNTDHTIRPPVDIIPGKKEPATTTNNGQTGKNEILANIDKYLVSKATFDPPPASGGITNAGVTVQNTLPNITFQKAFIEVSILMADGAEFRTDYYTMQNIEPGDIKTVKVPNAARGTTIVCHVVKLKSEELTNGEMLLVGSHFVAK